MSNWDVASFVSRSKYREKIVKELDLSPRTPTGLSERLSFPKSSVSNTLSDLEDKGLVKKLTKARKGRFYSITRKGEKTLNKVRSMED